MSNKNDEKNIPNWALADHSKPKTRREFLAHGLIPFIASTFLPNPLELLRSGALLETAHAGMNCASSGHNWTPVVQIDLAGGAGLMANFVPKDQGGQLLPSYNRMGLGKTPPLLTAFGGASFYTNSGILAGINSRASQQVLDRTSMFGVCVQSGDDRSTNLMAINGVLQKLGINGINIPHSGTQNSASAGRHAPALIPVDGPLVVSDFNALTSALGYTRTLNSLSQSQKEKLTRLAQSLNESQARKLARESDVDVLAEHVTCAAQKNTEVVAAGTSIVDPRQSQAFQTIWGINTNTQVNNQNLIFASLVYNSLRKNAGSATLVLGGYDYHGQSRAATDQLDRQAGELIGRVLASAEALQTPVFIIVTSDGAVGSDTSDTPGSQFTSDRGSAGVLYAFTYHPVRRINLKKNQLGHFESGQLAAEKSVVGGSTERAMAAILANYAAMHNRIGDFELALGRQFFSPTELDEIILIG
jgi:hypothetical protein